MKGGHVGSIYVISPGVQILRECGIGAWGVGYVWMRVGSCELIGRSSP